MDLERFMIETKETLAKILVTQENVVENIKEMKPLCSKIPLMEQGLNNHLTAHDKLKNRILYPIFTGLVIVIGGGFIKYVLHWI